MDVQRRWLPRALVAPCAALALALAAAPAAASSPPFYKVSVTGSQTVQWSFDGQVAIGSCGDGTPITQQGHAAGTQQFTFATTKKGFAAPVARPFYMSFDVTVRATGKLTAVDTLTNSSTCDGGTPADDFTADTSSCGSEAFSLHVNGTWKNGSVQLTGDEDITKPSTPPRGDYFKCPFIATATGVSLEPSHSKCEDVASLPFWRRTHELASFGRGLGQLPIAATTASLLHPKHKVTTLTRRLEKRCTMTVSASSTPLQLDVVTREVVTLVKQ